MKDKQAYIPTKFNEEELLIHNWLKDFFGFSDVYGENSQTIKQAEIVAYNVLHGLFGSNLKDIFKRESKERLTEIRAIQKEKQRISNTKGSTKAPFCNTKA
jgi:hypothetical protein